MTYILSDIFIGNFPVSQLFGANPQNYVRFGISGHDGMDFACPVGTPITAAADGIVTEVAYDQAGYGNYVKVVHTGYLTLYGHLKQAIVPIGQKVVKGQLLGYSGNTGNVFPLPTPVDPNAGAHLHFGVAPCDSIGNKTEAQNGFSGYIDPNGSRCAWRTVNLAAPIDPTAAPIIPGQTTPNSTNLQQELHDATDQRDSLQKDIDNTYKPEITDEQKQIGELKAQILQYQTSTTVIQRQLEAAKARIDQLTIENNQIPQLTQEIKELEAELDHLKETNGTAVSSKITTVSPAGGALADKATIPTIDQEIGGLIRSAATKAISRFTSKKGGEQKKNG